MNDIAIWLQGHNSHRNNVTWKPDIMYSELKSNAQINKNLTQSPSLTNSGIGGRYVKLINNKMDDPGVLLRIELNKLRNRGRHSSGRSPVTPIKNIINKLYTSLRF